jgi:hypothetical protein
MDSTIIVALISFAGTLIGTAGGILASGKLTAFRLEQLEKKLDNQSRTVSKIPVIEEKISNMNRRIFVLEQSYVKFQVDYDGC